MAHEYTRPRKPQPAPKPSAKATKPQEEQSTTAPPTVATAPAQATTSTSASSTAVAPAAKTALSAEPPGLSPDTWNQVRATVSNELM